jgi:hypothetical protein
MQNIKPIKDHMPYQLAGFAIVSIGLALILITTGIASSFASTTSYSFTGFAVSSSNPEDKIIDITQELGPIDVLIELTAPTEQAVQQQKEVLANISQYVIAIKQQFIEASNALLVTVDASNLIDIAKNTNVALIQTVFKCDTK